MNHIGIAISKQLNKTVWLLGEVSGFKDRYESFQLIVGGVCCTTT